MAMGNLHVVKHGWGKPCHLLQMRVYPCCLPSLTGAGAPFYLVTYEIIRGPLTRTLHDLLVEPASEARMTTRPLVESWRILNPPPPLCLPAGGGLSSSLTARGASFSPGGER